MKRYDPGLIEKIGKRTSKDLKYIRERISQRALNHNISPEAELANWARSLGISADPYIRRLPPNVQSQIYSPPSSSNNNLPKSSVLRIVRFGKKENEWYNLWWVQLLIAFLVVGILANIISQIFGVYFTNLLGLTKP
jgi:hypothetical protein